MRRGEEHISHISHIINDHELAMRFEHTMDVTHDSTGVMTEVTQHVTADNDVERVGTELQMIGVHVQQLNLFGNTFRCGIQTGMGHRVTCRLRERMVKGEVRDLIGSHTSMPTTRPVVKYFAA